MESDYFQKISNLMRWCGTVAWCDYVVFFQNNLFVRWFLNDFFCFQLRLFKTWSCDWQCMCFCLSQRIPQITIKTREKKLEIFFFQEQSKINKETWIFVLNFYFHHFFQKAFFWRTFFFRCKLSKVYKLIQHNQVLPVSPLTF